MDAVNIAQFHCKKIKAQKIGYKWTEVSNFGRRIKGQTHLAIVA